MTEDQTITIGGIAGAEFVDTTDIELTASIVSAYVSNNSLPAVELPALIASVYAEVSRIARGASHLADPAPAAPPSPAVPVETSITDDYIICLEDGKKFKSLKRHLGTAYGMTPDEYRMRWGLPSDYPMVAPGYSAVRSGLAKSYGLGTKPTNGAVQ